MIIRSPRDFGFLVRDARGQRGLTQAQLAARVGVSRKWIIDVEGGKRTVDLSLVLRTLNALGIDLDATMRNEGTPGGVDISAIVDASSRNRKT